MTEEQHRDNIEFIRQASENAKVSLVLANIKSEIEKSKLWKGFSKYPNARKHDVGLDRHYDMGLDKAIEIIDKYIEQY